MCFKDSFSNHGMKIEYPKNDVSLLNQLCDKYGSDKGEMTSTNPYPWQSHTYTDFYDMIFGLNRASVSLIIECGIGTNNPNIKSSMGINGNPGASLRVWQDFFPSAQIIGCDIDKDILFQNKRIKTFYCDQTNPNSIKNFIKNAQISLNSADIIIDDGLHEFEAGKCFFFFTIPLLKKDGIYIVEDVKPDDLVKFKNFFSNQLDVYDVRYIELYSTKIKGYHDNRLIFIKKK